jgi:uncharacterized FlaG/YvyC family protein
MKKICILIFILIFSSVCVAQTKVALIDTSVFSDREKGIKILVKAENSYSIEYYEIGPLTKRINELDKEKKSEYERKYSIIVKPVIEKISGKLQEFIKSKGYTIVIDKSQTTGIVGIVEDKTEDITKEFIRFCNESFEVNEIK